MGEGWESDGRDMGEGWESEPQCSSSYVSISSPLLHINLLPSVVTSSPPLHINLLHTQARMLQLGYLPISLPSLLLLSLPYYLPPSPLPPSSSLPGHTPFPFLISFPTSLLPILLLPTPPPPYQLRDVVVC